MDEDTRKVIELICAALPPHQQNEEDDFSEVDLKEKDFKRQGLTIDAGVAILKHKISGHYAVVNVSDISYGDPETSMNEEVWGQLFVSLEAHPMIFGYLNNESRKDGETTFTFKDCVLTINNNSISFGTSDSKEKGCYVLEHLFSHDLKEVSDYRDIHDMYFSDEPFKPKKYYDACQVIQKRISKEARIPDFLIFNASIRGSVRINQKYLP